MNQAFLMLGDADVASDVEKMSGLASIAVIHGNHWPSQLTDCGLCVADRPMS